MSRLSGLCLSSQQGVSSRCPVCLKPEVWVGTAPGAWGRPWPHDGSSARCRGLERAAHQLSRPGSHRPPCPSPPLGREGAGGPGRGGAGTQRGRFVLGEAWGSWVVCERGTVPFTKPPCSAAAGAGLTKASVRPGRAPRGRFPGGQSAKPPAQLGPPREFRPVCSVDPDGAGTPPAPVPPPRLSPFTGPLCSKHLPMAQEPCREFYTFLHLAHFTPP